LVLENAMKDKRFSTDKAVLKHTIKSVLCIPVLSKASLIAIIYLENNLAEAAFTSSNLQTLKMLSGQMAISLENALLYENLEQKVQERTRQLEDKQHELKYKNQALQEANKEKDELINIVAHDLRSPLNQIRGMANLIKMEEERLSNDQQQYINLITQSGERLGQMITNILSISTAPDQKPALNLEDIDLNDLAQELTIHYKLGASKKNIDLLYLPSDEAAIARIDRNYLFQAIENLVSNAIKFSPEGKQVMIRVITNQGSVRIEVQDQGPGISERDRKRLFTKYQTLSAKPTAGEASTGLGLSIAKRFVEAMNGRIEVESEVGHGAIFGISFPTTKPIAQ
jgi:signal transduction histidine kinase